MRKLTALFKALFLLGCLLPTYSFSQTLAEKKDTKKVQGRYLFSADHMTYDVENEILTATGHVEIHHQGRILMADKIRYDKRKNKVQASGNVSLLETTGDIAFADRIELEDGFKSGFIENVRILMSDNSRFAANGARRYADERTEMAKAVFSPCKACKKDPNRPPLWQIKAVKIIHDHEKREIEYQNAFLEVFGVPVAYVPYFRHPDPTVKRASGLLTPDFSSSSELGFVVSTPYFINIAPDRDLTVTPTVMTREGAMLGAEYRQLTDNGRFEIAANGAYVQQRDELNRKLGRYEFRNNIDATGRFKFRRNWTWGFDLERASDDTFLERYRISDAETLTSDLFLQRLRRRDYLNVTGYAFQGLNVEDDNGTTPYVLPVFDLEHELKMPTGYNYGRLTIIANTANLYRTEGTDSNRVSAGMKWNAPFIGPAGQLIKINLSTRFDAFRATSSQTGANGNQYDFRFWPRAAVEWRWPFAGTVGNFRHIVEPVVQLVAAPNGGNGHRMQNEDSQTVDFDASNLFTLDRNNGFDRVEDGIRVNYGVATSFIDPKGGHLDFLAGQVYRLSETRAFSATSGLNDNRSDFVLQTVLAPNEHLDLISRLRLAKGNLSLRRNEIESVIRSDLGSLRVNYLRLKDVDPALTTGLREEIFAEVRANITKEWTMKGHIRRDLTSGGRTLKSGIGISYEDECLIFSISYDKDETSDRDAPASNSINFRIVLKSLG